MNTFQDNPMECSCCNWARTYPSKTEHHPECPIECSNKWREARPILVAMLEAIRCWAADEDGVHPEACEPYNRAARLLGQPEVEDGQ